nr:cysteine desulfurase [Euryhalocaulis caribicus]
MSMTSGKEKNFDPLAFKSEFPIFERTIRDKPLVYLDSAASAQKPRAVIDAVTQAMEHSFANVHRGLHTMANETTEAFEGARAEVARFLNAPSADNIVFTRGTTEAINLVASSFGAELEAGDEIILSQMEHHSNIVPWHFLRERQGVVLKWVPVTEDGRIDMDAYAEAFSDRTKLVTMTHMSNVTGTRTDGEKIVSMAHDKGVPVLLDGSQSAVHGHVDVQALDVDFFAITGHKIYGPTGIGALYAKSEQLNRIRPYQGGGEMIAEVFEDRVVYADAPAKFEAGTPPIIDAIGLGAALKWLDTQDRDGMEAHERALLDKTMTGLAEFEDLRVIGTAQNKASIITFVMGKAHAHDAAQLLDRYGVAVRAGHHCAQPLMRRFDASSSVRASYAAYNTMDDVETFLDALRSVRGILM